VRRRTGAERKLRRAVAQVGWGGYLRKWVLPTARHHTKSLPRLSPIVGDEKKKYICRAVLGGRSRALFFKLRTMAVSKKPGHQTATKGIEGPESRDSAYSIPASGRNNASARRCCRIGNRRSKTVRFEAAAFGPFVAAASCPWARPRKFEEGVTLRLNLAAARISSLRNRRHADSGF